MSGNNPLKPYIIAETAYNHEGDYDYLCRMVDEIADCGLDAVKFHLLLKPESYMQRDHPLLDELRGWTFSEDEWEGVIRRAKDAGLEVIALCDDVESAAFIMGRGLPVDVLELHATGINDHFLLEGASDFHKKVFLGVGGTTLDEVQYAIDFLKERGKSDITLMYGFQSYPTNYMDINLSKMKRLENLFGLPVGYADHTAFDDPNNILVSAMAAAMGYHILEKHYTLDFGVDRIDHHSAVDKEKLLRIRELMELALMVHGDGNAGMSEPELKYGNVGPMKKAIVARRDIKKGKRLSADDLWFKRTKGESTLRQGQFLQLIGLEALQDIAEDEIVDFTKVRYEFKERDLKSYTKLKGDGSEQE